jgi:hypothetical protein
MNDLSVNPCSRCFYLKSVAVSTQVTLVKRWIGDGHTVVYFPAHA